MIPQIIIDYAKRIAEGNNICRRLEEGEAKLKKLKENIGYAQAEYDEFKKRLDEDKEIQQKVINWLKENNI